MASDFELQLQKDVKDVFLTGDFSVEAVYNPDTDDLTIRVQLFEDALDKMDTLYDLVWCSYADLATVQDNDVLRINGIDYGIVDSTPDEHKMGMNLFLNKVT